MQEAAGAAVCVSCTRREVDSVALHGVEVWSECEVCLLNHFAASTSYIAPLCTLSESAASRTFCSTHTYTFRQCLSRSHSLIHILPSLFATALYSASTVAG